MHYLEHKMQKDKTKYYLQLAFLRSACESKENDILLSRCSKVHYSIMHIMLIILQAMNWSNFVLISAIIEIQCEVSEREGFAHSDKTKKTIFLADQISSNSKERYRCIWTLIIIVGIITSIVITKFFVYKWHCISLCDSSLHFYAQFNLRPKKRNLISYDI